MKLKQAWFWSSITFFLSILVSHASAAIPCSVGQRGEVLWKGAWYSAQVLDTSGNSCYITYDGYDSSWNEWVELTRFRATFYIGQAVKIKWKGQWYPGRILDASRNSYRITYDGYDSSWDEWVEPARLRY
ncbi:RNA binding activity-knot of a chromodomain protein [Xenococcus sp. PCC 7305]|uniref:agenet domain-containing protein n=1 Tax=Xenococcus sp. PCC 7305 TaxID=102125 RepID=UPI0002AC5A90|nr:agenet domain-containing protein [Xenococcus sp. PCC 7305]ELS01437.1 RNA binding activity-knot of a chromodomain protein [Xenococcus sp. PCC 7305]